MIAYIHGTIAEKSPTRIVVDVNGLGYEIHIPVSTYEKLPAAGERIRLLTYLHVREDILQLYGFGSEEQRALFLELISISGIGPRTALGVLSKVSVSDFTAAVLNENFSLLTQIPGIGKKTAQRLVMELKDKLQRGVEPITSSSWQSLNVAEEAVLALVSLGYRQIEAQKLVNQVLAAEKQVPSVESLIKKALQTVG